jgi:putative nucleotidyltransferase with HDIG domain
MKRILFVDDEPKLLEGLQRMLRGQRRVWDMQFAVGAIEALAILETSPVDVVVTDMRMPGMDGAELLKCIHLKYPGIMRIILSGQFDAEAGMRAVPVAHQFLVKPCDPEKLKAVIERSSLLSSAISDEATRRVVSAVDSLPSPSLTCTQLLRELENAQSSLESVARIIGSDVAITAKVLQLANSAFFTLPREVSNLRDALSCLGLDILKQLVLSAEILRCFHPVRPIPGFSLEGLEAHSLLTARIAKYLAQQFSCPSGLAELTAMLHDTGKLVLATRLPDQYQLCCALRAKRDCPLHEAEQEVFGTTHAEVGAYLLNLWGFPAAAVEAILLHHRPTSPISGEFDLRAVIYVSNLLAHDCQDAETDATRQETVAGGMVLLPKGTDTGYLTALGVVDRFPVWRAAVRQFIAKEAA